MKPLRSILVCGLLGLAGLSAGLACNALDGDGDDAPFQLNPKPEPPLSNPRSGVDPTNPMGPAPGAESPGDGLIAGPDMGGQPVAMPDPSDQEMPTGVVGETDAGSPTDGGAEDVDPDGAEPVVIGN